ncbi:MAG: type II toxin-antitoxin system RelE/ParE family toxin [Candidatus Gracilibacteria bacterium]|nr:type II toxin-antitoxin system RelE/ParE family toxin [Candidatus Gracilibacteria bacterium]
MPQVALSRKAQSDLQRLYNFLVPFDTDTASQAIDTILDAFENLHMPAIGSPIAEKVGMRKLVIDFGDSGYTALYRYSKRTNVIRVLAIKHQKEDDYR